MAREGLRSSQGGDGGLAFQSFRYTLSSKIHENHLTSPSSAASLSLNRPCFPPSSCRFLARCARSPVGRAGRRLRQAHDSTEYIRYSSTPYFLRTSDTAIIGNSHCLLLANNLPNSALAGEAWHWSLRPVSGGFEAEAGPVVKIGELGVTGKSELDANGMQVWKCEKKSESQAGCAQPYPGSEADESAKSPFLLVQPVLVVVPTLSHVK